MNKKSILTLLLTLIVFVGLVFYNYQVAQKKIRETKPSPLSITLETFPETVIQGNTGTFVWHIDSSPDLSTGKTTIYWGKVASPSALTLKDSPEAVGYPHHQEDYFTGSFKLPDTFDVSIKFDEPGWIFFRAYAKVGNNYLWTPEESVYIEPNPKYVPK